MDNDQVPDHDLLIELRAIVQILKTGQDNHLEHHRKHDLMMLTVTIGSIFTSIIAIGTAIVSFIV